MTVKKNPSADSPGDFVGRGGLGAGGGRTSTGSTGGKSIVTGRKSSVSDKAKEKLQKKDKDNGEKDKYILYITKRDGTQTHDMVSGSKVAAEAKATQWALAKGGNAVKSVKIRKYGSDSLGEHPKGKY